MESLEKLQIDYISMQEQIGFEQYVATTLVSC